MNIESKLDFAIKNNFNVLLIGRAGCGKTALVKQAFDKAGLKSLYFSGATMDPFLELLGIPKEVKDDNGIPYLDYILPKHFRDDDIEAIFLDEYNRCLSGETKIPLADGHSVEIQKLVGIDHFYVYAFDQETQKIVIAKAHSARKTQKNEKMIKITLDNGAFVKCTVDHPFLTFNNEFKQANQLKIGDGLMPLYRMWNSNGKTKLGYEQVYQPKLRTRWDLTYYLADDFNIKNNIYKYSYGDHRHHIDFNKNNNSPENIIRLSQLDHILVHSSNKEQASIAGKKNHILHPDLYAKTIGTNESRTKALANSIKTRQTSISYKKKRSKASKEMYTPELREKRSNITEQQWKSGQFNNIDRSAALKINHITRTYNLLAKYDQLNKLSEDTYNNTRLSIGTHGHCLITYKKIIEWFGTFDLFIDKMKDIDKIKKNGNHKIINIQECDIEDVYDITVDDYHNFAIEAGVFVHNSKKSVRNSVMELIQFKSINGRKLNKLKVVFAAINEDEDDIKYDVEPLDPAQKDRFQIIIDVPYLPSLSYFTETFGKEMAETAISFWKELGKDLQKEVSPRRLDYALQIYKAAGDLRDVLPIKINVSKLLNELEQGSYTKRMNSVFEAGDIEEASKFITIENNYSSCIETIIKNKNYTNFFMPLISEEKSMSLFIKHKSIENYLLTNAHKYENILWEFVKSNGNSSLVKKIKEAIKAKPVKDLPSLIKEVDKDTKIVRFYTKNNYIGMNYYNKVIYFIELLNRPGYVKTRTQDRVKAYKYFEQNIPEEMSEEEATKTFEALSNIAEHSNKTYTQLIPMINHTLLILAKNNIVPNINTYQTKELLKYPDYLYSIYDAPKQLKLNAI